MQKFVLRLYRGRYSPMYGIVANVVLHDLEVNFQSEFSNNVLKTATTKVSFSCYLFAIKSFSERADVPSRFALTSTFRLGVALITPFQGS